jgi:hypothetical protein
VGCQHLFPKMREVNHTGAAARQARDSAPNQRFVAE